MLPSGKNDVAANDVAWHIEIASGPNAGALVPLKAGRYRVGQGLDSEIVLADAAVAAEQAVIAVGDNGATVEALAPGVRLNARRLSIGAQRRLRSGAKIMLGMTQLRIRGPRRRAGRWVPFVLAVPFCATAVCLLVLRAPAMTAPPMHSAALPRHTTANAKMVSSDAVVGELRAHLARARIGSAITLAAQPGAVLATGALLPLERERWTEAQMWFDQRFRTNYVLIDKVGVATPQQVPHLDVGAVGMSPVPYVISTSGDRYMEGAVLQGGWSIAHIAPDRIVLRNGEREIDITF